MTSVVSETLVAIITGSLDSDIEIYLEDRSLAKYFDFEVGGFGSEYFVRTQFVEAAISAADKKYASKFRHKKIFVVGDTVHDIESTKKDHVKSIGVLIGTSNKQDLEKHNPDYILENLADTKKFLDIING